MKADLTWLIGRQLKAIEKKDYSWFFIFDDDSNIATEGPWRLVAAEGIVVTSEAKLSQISRRSSGEI